MVSLKNIRFEKWEAKSCIKIFWIDRKIERKIPMNLLLMAQCVGETPNTENKKEDGSYLKRAPPSGNHGSCWEQPQGAGEEAKQTLREPRCG